MKNLTTVILAAGHGKRMKSKLPKVLHQVGGQPMVKHVIDLAKAVQSDEVICVVGHGKEIVKEVLKEEQIIFVEQLEQLGTGHAVMMADQYIRNGEILVLFGDAPLLSMETLETFVDFHRKNEYGASLISTHFSDPTGYGRIIRNSKQEFIKIVEHKDATDEERKVTEINSGIGLFRAELLKDSLGKLKNENNQSEYYLTDVFEIIRGCGHGIGAFVTGDPDELMGVNDRYSLSLAEKYMQSKILKKWMMSGVTIVSPETTYIEKNVVIGRDTTLYPGTLLKGMTVIGEDCHIGPNADLLDVVVDPKAQIKHSTLIKSHVGEKSVIGPYAYLRPGSMIGKNVKIGDFVEIKNSTIGDDSKVSHLTYVGDGMVGKNVNLGCGVVFVNYDGSRKHLTEIEDDVFVGCNSNLIAPVKIGSGAYIAAGSTITDDVPSEALAIARQRQVNKTEWSNKYSKKK
ncbi:MAG: bifunctional UDP-N-acetylglucosamine diphosphorylase/glucosamine-1-phosphate N-acetyltransferase GlmU [Clostridia bacterium]|nr:bifunctional UDP-N-acetylglucosamine diphosphorylase/glucosamine-1-phosphate N-acetyltransferase GlmU [Clostridia bacterium]